MIFITRCICLIFFLPFSDVFASDKTSICYGTTSNGRLESGVQLPANGANFEAYSRVARLAGRTYVHSSVQTVILHAYTLLEKDQPGKVYKYAETGYEEGGQFKPHKTHRNGLSVDFMTPVINETGDSVHLPTHVLNKFGYDIEFDSNGVYESCRIDFDAMAAHIVALHKEAKKLNLDLWRVIFDPDLQPGLFKTAYAGYLKKHIKFSRKRSWVRHDEHYHIDFMVACRKR